MFDWGEVIVVGVIIGFIINVVAGLATPKIQNLLGRYSQTIRSRNEKARQEFERDVNLLLADPQEEIKARLDRNHEVSLTVTGYALIAVVMVGVDLTTATSPRELREPFLTLWGIGSLLLGTLLGGFRSWKYTGLHLVVSEADKRKREAAANSGSVQASQDR